MYKTSERYIVKERLIKVSKEKHINIEKASSLRDGKDQIGLFHRINSTVHKSFVQVEN